MTKKIKSTWKNTPKIINKIPKDKNKYIMYIDESGNGNQETLKKAYYMKKENCSYTSRNNIFVLNGVVLTGEESYVLEKRFNTLKRKITPNGMYGYNDKELKPILLRNYDIDNKKKPFDNMNKEIYDNINKVIKNTNFIQIVCGMNYYSYTENNDEALNKSPTIMCLGVLVLNFAELLNEKKQNGIIIFEAVSKKQDMMKLKYILKLINKGNKTSSKYFKRIKAVYFRNKWTKNKKGQPITTAGIELADLTISPIRNILDPEYLVIERKLFESNKKRQSKGINIIT